MNSGEAITRAEVLFSRLEVEGEKAIEEFIATRTSEELFLDFKRSSNSGSGKGLSQTDRDNLAKAISGFGNSEGGVVIWGIDCSRDHSGADVARAKYPLDDAPRFASWVEGAVSGCTVPPHSGVRSIAIPIGDGLKGFVGTYIPRSFSAPHQVIRQMRYYIRAGSDFVPAPHMVLAGMFGRPMQPHVFNNFLVGPASMNGSTVSCDVGIVLRNSGPSVAADLFITVRCWEFPGPPSSLEFVRPDEVNWSANWAFGRIMSLISKVGFRVPPEGQTQPLILKIQLNPPFDCGIELDGILGAGASLPYRFHLQKSRSDVEQLYDDLFKHQEAGTLTNEYRQSFISAVLGIDDLQISRRPT